MIAPPMTAGDTRRFLIYSLKDVRDETLGAALGRVMLAGRLTTVTRVRRDPHDAAGTCVVHGATTCPSAS